jgi:hypothetical protein
MVSNRKKLEDWAVVVVTIGVGEASERVSRERKRCSVPVDKSPILLRRPIETLGFALVRSFTVH